MKKKLKLVIFAFAFIPIFAFSQTNKKYIIISYSSICCGTPSEKPIMNFVKNFQKKNKLKPFEIFVEQGLGKEGEHSFYIGTDNLNSKLFKSFWKGLKNTASTQNKNRLENQDGYVNLISNLTSNSTLKIKKIKPRKRISSMEIYDYRK